MPSNALFSMHSLPVLKATLENFSCNFLKEKNSCVLDVLVPLPFYKNNFINKGIFDIIYKFTVEDGWTSGSSNEIMWLDPSLFMYDQLPLDIE